jgi:hypothetical protein
MVVANPVDSATFERFMKTISNRFWGNLLLHEKKISQPLFQEKRIY